MTSRPPLPAAALLFATSSALAAPGAEWLAAASESVAASARCLHEEPSGTWTAALAGGMSATWDRGAVALGPVSQEAGWRLRYELRTFGRGSAPSPCRVLAETVEGSRLEWIREGGVTEWHASEACGLEFGFRIDARPDGEGELVLEGSLGAAGARPSELQDRIVLHAGDDVAAEIGGLLVLDAGGAEVPSRMELAGGVLRIVVDDREAAYPLHVDPYVTTPMQRFEVNSNGAFLGQSVSDAGDVNGDGYGDVIVGAYTWTLGALQGQEGAAFVFLGQAGGIDAVADWRVESNQAAARLGTAVAGAGDVNGDGFDDVAVGAPLWDGAAGADAGAVFVFFGSPGFGGNVAAASADVILEGENPGAGFGSAVDTAGDLDADGWDELVVGASLDDTGGLDAGAAYAFEGIPGGLIGTGPSSATWTFPSPQAGSRFGISVGGGGDVNGDGYGDLAIGAYLWDGGQSDEGAAFVYLGGPAGPGTLPAWRAEGDLLNTWAGQSVAISGSVNCDRFADVLVGAPQGTGRASAHLKEGWVAVYHGGLPAGPGDAGLGPNGTPLNADWFAESNQGASRFGGSVAILRDSKCSTCADVIIGSPWWDASSVTNRGAVFVWEGSPQGLGPNGQTHLTPPAGGPDLTLVGPRASDEYGTSVAGVLTVDGDRGDDLFIGSPGYDNGHSNEGAAWLHASLCTDASDADGDGVPTCCDLTPGNGFACNDSDTDRCDDCAAGFGDDPSNDGPDLDGDGACDLGDPDDDADGVPDTADNCPRAYNPGQLDSDLDGLGDACDPCPFDPVNDVDGDGYCANVDNCPTTSNPTQLDSDLDGAGDACDPCPFDPFDDADGDTVCGDVDNCPLVGNQPQDDADLDGLGDACDACPLDPANDADGDGVCGDVDNCPVDDNPGQENTDGQPDGGDACDADDDDDGVDDGPDNCDLVVNPTQDDCDGDAVGDACDTEVDSDGDTICDPVDNCPANPNPLQEDCDADAIGDACDAQADADGDLVCESADNCPGLGNPGQADTDTDGAGDACDSCTDVDADGFGDPGPADTCPADNCPVNANTGQDDADADGAGDACDPCTDSDGDGFGDPGPADTCPADNCPALSNVSQADADLDGIGDDCDTCAFDPLNDIDADSVCGDVDNCPIDFNPTQANTDGQPDGGDTCDPDDDDDAVPDGFDNCQLVANPSQADCDADMLGDACDADVDSDGDSFCDAADNCPTTSNPGQDDADLDGAGDLCDSCTDSDSDGFGDPGPADTCPADNCPAVANTGQEDADADGIGDACDVEGAADAGSCSDGLDNDGDGDIDCADADCAGVPPCP